VYDQIRKEEQPYLQNSYKMYEDSRADRYEWSKMKLPESRPNYLKEQYEIREKNIQLHVEHILNNRLPIDDQTQDFITNRLIHYSDWKKTTMILRPGLEPWIHRLISNDPMYLIDENYDLLTPIMSQFNEVYQRRVRTYVIREDQEQDILWELPNNQFSLILAWNYFNHIPFEILRRYLTEIYKKMKPGGMLLMTYNDCDRWEGVESAEIGNGLYTPGGLIKGFAESLGFEQHFIYHHNGPWTWVEYRKPGEWNSLRGGSSLAKILPK